MTLDPSTLYARNHNAMRAALSALVEDLTADAFVRRGAIRRASLEAAQAALEADSQLPRCCSDNHGATGCDALPDELWQCAGCERWFCLDEGGDDSGEDLCDDCRDEDDDKPRLTFIVEDATVFRHFANEADATVVREDIQSVNGSRFEQDGAFIYAVVNDPDAAVRELEASGYDVVMR